MDIWRDSVFQTQWKKSRFRVQQQPSHIKCNLDVTWTSNGNLIRWSSVVKQPDGWDAVHEYALLLQVQTDIMAALDDGSVAGLLVLDLLGASSNLDHYVLLIRTWLLLIRPCSGSSIWILSFRTGDTISAEQLLYFPMYSRLVVDIIKPHGHIYSVWQMTPRCSCH